MADGWISTGQLLLTLVIKDNEIKTLEKQDNIDIARVT